MEDKVYCGRLVSDDKLEHSSGPWKKHAYVKKTQEDGYTRYWYPGELNGKRKENIQNGASDEELKAAEDEYSAAEAAYRNDPSPENRKRLDEAEEEVSRARAIKRRDGNYKEKDTKTELAKEAVRKGKELFSRSKESYRTDETRSMPANDNSEAEDRKKKRKSLSLFNHGVRHTGSKKKESKSDEVLKLEPTGKAAENSNVTRKAGSNSSGINGPDKLQNYAGAPLTYGAQPSDYSVANRKRNGLISRPKNMVGRYASKHAMDEFKKDHPNVHELNPHSLREAELSTSIDASPVKDKKLRKQKVGRR